MWCGLGVKYMIGKIMLFYMVCKLHSKPKLSIGYITNRNTKSYYMENKQL